MRAARRWQVGVDGSGVADGAEACPDHRGHTISGGTAVGPDGWLAVGGAAALLWLGGRTFFQPVAFLLRAALQVVVGGLVLYGWDRLTPWPNLAMGINPVTAAVVGWLGAPGFGLLLGLHWVSQHAVWLGAVRWP
jgi:inhibitor of the pro-sigma K processing machinery